MRRIVQPGPPVSERIQWVETRGRAFSFTIEADLPLLEAVRRGFAAQGFASGTLNIALMPGLAPPPCVPEIRVSIFPSIFCKSGSFGISRMVPPIDPEP